MKHGATMVASATSRAKHSRSASWTSLTNRATCTTPLPAWIVAVTPCGDRAASTAISLTSGASAGTSTNGAGSSAFSAAICLPPGLLRSGCRASSTDASMIGGEIGGDGAPRRSAPSHHSLRVGTPEILRLE
jgi:hypothetical protein